MNFQDETDSETKAGKKGIPGLTAMDMNYIRSQAPEQAAQSVCDQQAAQWGQWPVAIKTVPLMISQGSDFLFGAVASYGADMTFEFIGIDAAQELAHNSLDSALLAQSAQEVNH